MILHKADKLFAATLADIDADERNGVIDAATAQHEREWADADRHTAKRYSPCDWPVAL